MIALSQLSRAVEQRGGKPRLSDLRDSGSIEQDANVVLLMFRPDYYEKDPAKLAGREGICEVQIAKNRAGQTGRVNLMFNGPTTSFAECEVDDEGRFLKFL